MDESLSESASDEALLEHWSWVRRLAGQLVRDPESRDEVVQQTWLVALEKRPNATNLRAWLRRVVQRTAHHRYRSDARRTAHERAAQALADVPDPAELAAQAERWHGLVGAIARLDEPYRSTILLRFYRDLSPRDIARRLDVPAATVRSRLKRGLAQLRTMLDREHDGNRAAWCVLLAPAAAAVPGTAMAAGTGALLMGTKAKAALACAVVAASVVTWTVMSERASPPSNPIRETARAAASLPEAMPRADRSVVLDESSDAGAHVEVLGSVVDPDGNPITSAQVKLVEARDDGDGERLVAEAATDAAGEFRFEAPVSPEGELSVVARSDGYWADIERVFTGTPTTLLLEWRAILSGTIRDASTNEPIEGVEIRINNRDCVSDSSGWFRAQDLQAGVEAHWEAVRRGYVEASGKLQMSRARETTHDLTLDPGKPLWITVVDEVTGGAVAGARVLNFNRQRTIAETDPEGRVALYVESGSSINVRFAAEGHADTVWHYEVRDVLSMPSPKIPLRRLAWIEGSVSDGDGVGLEGAVVYAKRTAHGDGRVTMDEEKLRGYDLPGYAYFHSPVARTRTDSDGSFELTLAPGAVTTRVAAKLEGYASSVRRELQLETPGHRARADFVLRRGAAVHGRAERNGEPWRGTVICEDRFGVELARTQTDKAGGYELVDLPAGDVRLRVSGYALGEVPDAADYALEAGGRHQVDFIWEAAFAAIRGRVIRPSGEPVPNVSVGAKRWTDGVPHSASTYTDATGSYELEVPLGQAYTVSVFDPPQRIQVHEIASGATDVDFVLAPQTCLRLVLRDERTGQPAEAAWRAAEMVWCRSGDDELRRVRFHRFEEGVLQVILPIGLVDVTLSFGDTGYERVDLSGVAVEEDGEPILVHVQRGSEVLLQFHRAGDGFEDLSRRIVFALRDDELAHVRGPFERQGPHSNYVINGTILWSRDPHLGDSMLRIDQRGSARLQGMRSGRYTLWSPADDLVFEPDSFTVDEDASREPVSIDWSIR